MLNSKKSTKLARLVRVVIRATEVFEDPEAAMQWLTAPNSALSGATPLNLLDTRIGTESVLETLGQIEHGVFA